MAASAVFWLAACDGPPQSTEVPVVYVGALHEQDGDRGASIALVVQGDLVEAYACGEVPSERYPGWFSGEARADAASAYLQQNVQDSWRVEATWTADRAEGTLQGPDGHLVTWSASAARGAAPSGLYTAWSDGCMTGVIVDALNAAGEPIVRGTWCNAAGARHQVTPLRPIRLVDDRLTVQVMFDEGPRLLDVTPVHAVLE
jgi:hypothetical protein